MHSLRTLREFCWYRTQAQPQESTPLLFNWDRLPEEFCNDSKRMTTTNTVTRTVALFPEALALLASIPRVDGCPWVFPNPETGEPYYDEGRTWENAIAACEANEATKGKYTNARIHDIRHATAVWLHDVIGASVEEIQRQLGHASPVTTQIYLRHVNTAKVIDGLRSKVAAHSRRSFTVVPMEIERQA